MQIPTILRASTASLVATVLFSSVALAGTPAAHNPRAEALFNRAEAAARQDAGPFATRMRRAADLYLRSAAARDDQDPRRIESLRRAGNLLSSVDPQRSREVLYQAAEAALASGDVAGAASLYLDVAWVVEASRQRTSTDVRIARECIEKASRLAKGPSLSAQQRNSIVRRIAGSPTDLAAPHHARRS